MREEERRSRCVYTHPPKNDRFGAMTLLSAVEVTFLADLEEFVHDHRPHGSLTATPRSRQV